ncbi:phospholipase D family protein [Acinetobacter sp. NIPH 2699]|uniref:phospholipase D family protein n=1 Tax=Acinetobacter sp. NIPH 2699 TaxID=2923433 RepID=UPI001F4C517F|nr:phospholipase D family protein [Acinetobacter sp. NIPH 2699]MCH7337717.1 phospholipase D family protein [Acinetobacter sp. NIPH 2699]
MAQSSHFNRKHTKISTTAYNKNMLAIYCTIVLTATGCSTLPKHKTLPTPQTTFQVDHSQTSLAQIIQPIQEQHPELTGYHVLFEPLEALSARLSLIDKAEKSLDLQYYIWDNDKVGALALHALIRAADRGVKIRLLIDDNNAKQTEGIFLALAQHPNIEIKLFNPYRFRKYRAVDMILDLKRINRRMHNKSFIADHQIALIGGRNMTNQYYNVSENYQFSDVDVMLFGTAVKDISESFDDYWKHEYAYDVREIVKQRSHRLSYESLKHQLDEHYKLVTVQNYLDITNHSQTIHALMRQEISLNWVKAEVVKDSPDKIKSKAKKEEHLNFQLLNHLEQPEKNIDLISAYFVPEKKGAKILTDLAQDGIEVRVLTNSFKANDVAVVHAFYGKYRQELLEKGVQLYEFLPAIDKSDLDKRTEELAKKAKVSIKGLSRSSLHAKLMALDEKQVFIGSFNFDPRSAYLNTEIGVLLNSPALAQEVHSTMDQNLSKYAYKLVLDANKKITWHRQTPQGPIIYTKEPRMKWWQKAGVKIISWLPIEGFM